MLEILLFPHETVMKFQALFAGNVVSWQGELGSRKENVCSSEEEECLFDLSINPLPKKVVSIRVTISHNDTKFLKNQCLVKCRKEFELKQQKLPLLKLF